MFLHTLATFASVWAAVFLGNLALKTYRPSQSCYIQTLERYGLTISFGYIRYYTTALNRFFYKCGNWNRAFSRAWFGVGAAVGVVLVFVSVSLLVFTPIQALQASQPAERRVLTPVMPGVNVPWSDGAYYLLSLIICGVFHEAGHALAASGEQVRVNGFGVFLLFIYPGAFVDLHADHLSVISLKRQLRIYTAGVWHNVVLALVVLGLLVLLPWLLCPLYATGKGVVVVSVRDDGPLTGGKVGPGELITSVDSCSVLEERQWSDCLEALASTAVGRGYCVPIQLLEAGLNATGNATLLSSDGGAVECCKQESPSDTCFQMAAGADGGASYRCLPARSVAAHERCLRPSDCRGIGRPACVIPAVPEPSRLVRIARSGGQDLLFLGHPQELFYSLVVTDYVPVHSIVPLNLPLISRKLLSYVLSFSSALAVLNMLPAYALDGQWVLMTLVELCLERRLPNPNHRKALTITTLAVGTLLLIVNICIAMWTFMYW